MHDAPPAIFEVALVLIGGAFLAVAICSRLGLPSILGYLGAGLILGPTGTGALPDGEGIARFAELGVVFLLFMLGLEFSMAKLVELRRAIFGLGLVQVVAVTAPVALWAGLVLGLTPGAAIVLGGAVAMSSTALCLKQLAEQHELDTPHGRISVAVLLFQDLATAFFLILLGIAAQRAPAAESLLRVGLGIGILAVALFLMRAVMRPLTAWLSRHANSDLLQLTGLFLALGAAAIAHVAGLSPAIGAFLAGMLISESDARHVVEKEIRPFRDLLVGIFFVSVGTQIDLSRVFEEPRPILGWLLAIVGLKLVVVALIVRASGATTETALRTATILAHGGEFSLLLISLSLAQRLLDPAVAQPLLVALGVSVFLAPLLIRSNASISSAVRRLMGR